MTEEIHQRGTGDLLKGISTVVGAILVNLVVGSIFGLCTLSVYEVSYIKGKVKDSFITIDHLAFYYPFEVMFQTLSSFLSGIIEKKLGLHLTNLIGFTILGLGYFTMYLSQNFFIDILSMILGGIGTGIIYYPSTKNACLWFIEHNGIVIGVIETMISLGSFIFALMGEYIINPNEAESHEDDQLYDLEVGEKIKIFLLVDIACIVGVYILSFFLMHIKKEEKANTQNDKNIEMASKQNIQDGLLVYEGDTTEEESDSSKHNKENKSAQIKSFKKMIKVAIKSKRLIIYAIISIFACQGPSMVFTLYRGIGEYYKISTNTLQNIGSYNFIFECLSGIIVGVLCDYVNLKFILLTLGLANTTLIYTYCFTFKNDYAFFWSTNLQSFFNGGIFPFNDCYLMKVFGTDIYIELIGYISFVTNLFVVALSPLAYLVETKLEVKDNAFWILFTIFGTLNLISLVLSFFINAEPFNYDERLGLVKDKTERSSINNTEYN